MCEIRNNHGGRIEADVPPSGECQNSHWNMLCLRLLAQKQIAISKYGQYHHEDELSLFHHGLTDCSEGPYSILLHTAVHVSPRSWLPTGVDLGLSPVTYAVLLDQCN